MKGRKAKCREIKKTEGRKGKGMKTGKNKKKTMQAKASQAYCPSDYLVLGFKILL
jgi:hypothetical protein